KTLTPTKITDARMTWRTALKPKRLRRADAAQSPVTASMSSAGRAAAAPPRTSRPGNVGAWIASTAACQDVSRPSRRSRRRPTQPTSRPVTPRKRIRKCSRDQKRRCRRRIVPSKEDSPQRHKEHKEDKTNGQYRLLLPTKCFFLCALCVFVVNNASTPAPAFQ